MSSQNDLILQSNGGFKQLGWARMTTMFPEQNACVKLFNDSSFYGKIPCESFIEGFIFTRQNTPEKLFGQISRSYFMVFREPSTTVNFHPAYIRVLGRNGLFVNDKFVAQNEERILRTGDVINVSSKIPLFQFIDDRVYDTKGVPSRITSKYHLDKYFGKGGQSTVRMIHEFVNGGKFAMKIIPKSRFEEEDPGKYEKRLQHMKNEVKIMQQLRHINIIRLKETFITPSDLFIVMEFADTDLLKIMKTYPGAFLPENEAKFCLYQICKGLDHIHRKNIAHRDIKPENIFVAFKNIGGRNELILKIGDFGYSKKADQHLITQLGTPCYLPPEIQNNKGEYTLKADIWTLGCTFFACLSGTFPFDKRYGSPLAKQIENAQLNWSHRQWENVSPWVIKLIKALIRVDPEKRPNVQAIFNAKWFYYDPELKARAAQIYNFPVVEISKRMNSACLEEPEAKKQKMEGEP